jgi:hypothetical protein
MSTTKSASSSMDLEKYRLRRFVDRLIDMGEVEIASRERQNPHRATVPSVLLGAQVATRYRRAPRK